MKNKRPLYYIKFNTKGFNSKIDQEATRVSVPEQLEMLQFICADLPLARMPDTVDREDKETSSEDDQYDDFGSGDDIQERKDKSHKIKNVTKLTMSETLHKDIEEEGSTYGKGDNIQERKGKSPKVEKNVTKLTVSDTLHEDIKDEGSTSRGKKRQQKQ